MGCHQKGLGKGGHGPRLKGENLLQLLKADHILEQFPRLEELDRHHLVDHRHKPLVDRPHAAAPQPADYLVFPYILHLITNKASAH